MDWLIDIFSAEKQDTVAHIMLLYSIVIALGIYLGKIKILMIIKYDFMH